LLTKYAEGEIFEINENQWPESFIKLEPLTVRRYGGGLGIVRWKFVIKGSGLYIPLPSSTPKNTGNTGFERIDEDLYYYWISG